ncbi:MAG TPA: NAD(+)/NADH kinase [Candidatus Acidoferrales bacterium]|nr:NAD(+)/NADH kinase [Candidatus Acidoferrales bacterium]
MRIGIVSRCDVREAIQLAGDIGKHLKECVEIVYDKGTADKLDVCGVELKKFEVDAIVAVGGDGTILRVLQDISHPIPIIGINMGKVGFLAEISPENAFQAVDKLIEGFEVSAQSRLAISINGKELPTATNEAVIVTRRPAKILEYRIKVDGCLLDDLRADGVVIATSTGSTAYAMSAGGPIVDPRVDAFIIVPLAPYKLSARPWLIFSESTISVKMTGKDAVIAIDGQYSEVVHKNDVLTFKKADIESLFVVGERSFFEKVAAKLR